MDTIRVVWILVAVTWGRWAGKNICNEPRWRKAKQVEKAEIDWSCRTCWMPGGSHQPIISWKAAFPYGQLTLSVDEDLQRTVDYEYHHPQTVTKGKGLLVKRHDCAHSGLSVLSFDVVEGLSRSHRNLFPFPSSRLRTRTKRYGIARKYHILWTLRSINRSNHHPPAVL